MSLLLRLAMRLVMWMGVWRYLNTRNSGGWHPLVWFSSVYVMWIAAALWPTQPITALALSVVVVVMVFPSLLAKLSVRWGWQRLSMGLWWLSFARFGHDRAGASLWAAYLVAKRTNKDAHWARARLSAQRATKVRGTTLLTMAMIAQHDGLHAHAQQLVGLALHMHRSCLPPSLRRQALTWLCTERAAQGAWHRLAEVDPAGSPTAYVLVACAQKMLGMEPTHLGTTWKRTACLALAGWPTVLVQFVDEVFGAPAPHTTSAARPWTWNAWAQGVALGAAEAQRIGIITNDEWMASLRASVRSHVRAQVVSLDWSATHEHELDALVAEVLEEERGVCLDQVELLATSWRVQLASTTQSTLPSMPIVLEVIDAMVLAQRAQRLGKNAAVLMHESIDHALCDIAVWLWNVRDQRPLGHALFGHLLQQAQRVGDSAMVKLQQDNLKVGT
jgi:hypothetical protein